MPELEGGAPPPATFRMPSLGADMTDGTVLEWRIAPGDTVHHGDIVALVDTEKAEIEVEVFVDGVVEALVVPVGEKVPVGTVLARLAPLGTAVAAPSTAPPLTASPTAPAPAPAPTPEETRPVLHHPQPRVTSPLVRHLVEERHLDVAQLHGSGPGGAVRRSDVESSSSAAGRRRVSPRARALAATLGVDLAELVGSGPDGTITGVDVEGAAAHLPAAPAPAPASQAAERAQPTQPTDGADRMRRAIAALMTRSWREIPHYHLTMRIDLGRALAWLTATNAERPVTERVLPAALLLRATALAACDVPAVNGTWVEDTFRPSAHVDLGVAVALRTGGLIAPTIAAADELALTDLMVRLREVVTRARKGKLRGSDLAPASLTVTNLGDVGGSDPAAGVVELIHGVIHPPQVALVGFGAIHDEVVARDGMIAVRPIVVATLAGDHRASDGRVGAAFLTALAGHLQNPEML